MPRGITKGLHIACYMFGRYPRRLTHEQMPTATADERIESVWPFLVKLAIGFHLRMKPGDKVNFDIEDVLSELYIKLKRSDDSWSPERGLYITFAASLSRRVMSSIRDRAHTVHSPRNSTCRLKRYKKQQSEGDLKPKKERTLADMVRVVEGARPITDASFCVAADIPEPLLQDEISEERKEGIAVALRQLDPAECLIVRALSGLWEGEALSVKDLAAKLNYSDPEIRRVYGEATDKMRAYIREIDHPSLHS